MPVLGAGFEALVEGLHADLAAMRRFRDDAYELGVRALQAPAYQTDAEFKAAVDAVLAHFGQAPQQEG